MTARARTFWTPEEDNRLRMLLGAGKPIEIVASELKRSAKAVKARAYILRISLKRIKLKPKATQCMAKNLERRLKLGYFLPRRLNRPKRLKH